MLFKVIVLAVVFSCSAAIDTRLGANKGYVLEYFFKTDWYNANLFCRYHGLQLATIETAEQQTYIAKLIVTSGLPKEYFWISGSDLQQEGRFSWYSNGDRFQYTSWAPNQPDNLNNSENCVQIWNNQKWNDEACSHQFYFICEKPICPVCP